MKSKLTCPVCDRPDIEGDICPNCETNLSSLRILSELPVMTQNVPTKKLDRANLPFWVSVSIGILLLTVGISLGFSSNYLLSKEQQSIAQTSMSTSSPVLVERTTQSSSAQSQASSKDSCGGFYYTVQPEDSLSLIASHFYGNENFWSFIAQANPKIQNRENHLAINETLFIPNAVESCP